MLTSHHPFSSCIISHHHPNLFLTSSTSHLLPIFLHPLLPSPISLFPSSSSTSPNLKAVLTSHHCPVQHVTVLPPLHQPLHFQSPLSSSVSHCVLLCPPPSPTILSSSSFTSISHCLLVLHHLLISHLLLLPITLPSSFSSTSYCPPSLLIPQHLPLSACSSSSHYLPSPLNPPTSHCLSFPLHHPSLSTTSHAFSLLLYLPQLSLSLL